MRWPDGSVRDTELWLDPADSGKPRLRSLRARPVQIGRIIAPMLLLPDPTRAFKLTPLVWPIVRAKQYSVTQVGFGQDSEFAEMADRVTFTPTWIEVANQGGSEAIGVEARYQRIERVYARAGSGELPLGLAGLLESHSDLMQNTQPMTADLANIVRAIGRELTYVQGIQHDADSDPLPTLEVLLDIDVPDEPGLPPPDELSEDEPEISLRSAHQHRLTKMRGASGRAFSLSVRHAYKNRCAFCGLTLGAIDGIRSGIDAAHILAWSKHDLDVRSNGLALCKLHHWAFDAGLIMLQDQGTKYVVRHTLQSTGLSRDQMDRIVEDGFEIPIDWLPDDAKDRPSAHFLKVLYADLGLRPIGSDA